MKFKKKIIVNDVTILRTTAPIDDHARQGAVDHVHIFVEVQHVDRAEFPRRATGRRDVRRRHIGDVRVRKPLQR